MELFHRDNGLHVWLDIHYVEGETKNLEVLVWNTDSPTHGRLTDIYTFPSTSSTVVSFSRAPTEGRRDRLTNNMCVLLCSMFGRAGLTTRALGSLSYSLQSTLCGPYPVIVTVQH